MTPPSIAACWVLASLPSSEAAQSFSFKRTARPKEAAQVTGPAVFGAQLFPNRLSHAKWFQACTVVKAENASSCSPYQTEALGVNP